MSARWKRWLPTLALLLIVLAILSRGYSYRAPQTIDRSTLRLVDLNGSLLPSSAIEGKPLLLNYWAPWCAPCRLEMPWLNKLQQEHPEIAVVGVETDDDQYAQALALAKRQSIKYPLVKPDYSLIEAAGSIHALPTSLYVSRSGRIVHATTGIVPKILMQWFVHGAKMAP